MLNQISPVVILNGALVNMDGDVAFVSPPVYEVIRVIDGTPLFFEGHTNRLFKSLELIGIDHDLNPMILRTSIQTLVEETHIKDNNIRLEVGKNKEGTLVWILFWVKSSYPEKIIYEQGVRTVTSQSTRDNPHAKIYRSDFTTMINNLKVETGAYEVILVKNNGIITEGSRSNLFFIKGNTIYTAMACDVLMGITRQMLLDLIKTLSIEILELDIPQESLSSYDACFLTGTSIHILPISHIDEISYQSSQNPLIQKLQSALKKIVLDDLENTRRQLQ